MNLLLEEGLIAMCIGMGTVLSFLVMLIVGMILMSKVIGYLNKIFPEAVLAGVKPTARKPVGEDEQVAIAIAAVLARS